MERKDACSMEAFGIGNLAPLGDGEANRNGGRRGKKDLDVMASVS